MKMTSRSFLFLLSCVLVMGCSTLKKVATDPATAHKLGTIIHEGTMTATAATLMASPEKRTELEKVRDGLDVMLATHNIQPAALQAALSKLGVEQMQSSEGVLMVSGGLTVYHLLSSTFFDVESQEGLMILTQRARDGINDALNASQVAPPPALRARSRSAVPTIVVPNKTKLNTQTF